LPHESRMFGVNLTWRGIQFTYHRLARFDRSALGLNPLAVSYANPSNRLAERIEAFSIGFQRKRKKRVTQNNFSFTSYQIDNTSTTTYVFDRLSAAVYNARQNPNMTDFQRQALLENIKDNYASDERFAASRGFDARIESRLSTAISSKVLFSAGGQTRLAVGTPLSTYYTIPAPLVFDGVTNVGGPQPIETFTDATIDLNLFAQLEYRGKKMHIVGGTAANMAIFQGLKMSPRLGVLYKIDSAWSIRGSVSTGFRNNNLYAASNTYEIFSTPGTKPSIGQSNYVREHFYAYELGVREHSDNSKLEVFGFLQQVYDMSRPGFFIPGSGVVPSVIYGYNNTAGLSHQIWGAQAMFISESKSYLKVSGLRKETVISGKTELYIQYARGKEWYGNGLPATTSDVLNQPRWTTQFRLFFKLNKNIEIMMAANKQASSLSKSVLYSELFDLPDREERLRKYTTWDVVGRVYLSNHFLVYFNFQNVFDREHQGLDATGTQDDLLYNPQPGRFVRFGVNYNMN
jgi:outer membrane receptor for ferrienterochelin and colicin